MGKSAQIVFVGVAILAAFVVLSMQGTERREADAAPRASTDARKTEQSQRCDAEVDAKTRTKLGQLVIPEDAYCRTQQEQFVRAGFRANCSGESPLMALVEPCLHLRNLRQYCPPEVWPPDAFAPGTRAACKLN